MRQPSHPDLACRCRIVSLVGGPRLHEEVRIGGVLDASEVWARLHARLERALLEVDRIIACCFDRRLAPDECERGSEICAALAEAFAELHLTAGGDVIMQVASTFAGNAPGPAEAAWLSILVEDLRSILAVTASDAPVSDPDAPLLVVIGQPTRFTDGLLWIACTRGLRVVDKAPGPTDPLEAACMVVVCDEADPEVAGRRFRELAEQFGSCPIVFCARAAGMDVRLAVAPFVASAFIGGSPSEVVGEAYALIGRSRTQPVLAVFAESPDALVAELGDRGVDARAFTDVADLIRAVGSRNVHAVLVGADVDRSLRAAIPALVRNDPQNRHVGVISLLARNTAAEAGALMRAGTDAVHPVGVGRDVLGASCRERLQRAVEFSTRASSDQSTRSFSQPHAALLIDRMLVGAHRRRSSVSIGVLAFESATVDESRFAELSEPLSREFRGDDVIGSWTGNRYVIALKGVGRRTAVRRFDDLLRNLGLGTECRVGVTEFPHDGRALDELLSVSETLIARARADDGPRVVSSEWHAASAPAADVLVVDPDVTLRALIVTLLERQGMTVVQMNDGASAFDYLTASAERVRPRVLMMELDLMGIDGLQLLRRLRDAGVMGGLRVLVLTARIRESELLDALSLGASDVVTKPFSPGLLVHRLRRVMES